MTAIVTTRLIPDKAKLKARADTLVDFTVARVHGVHVLYACVCLHNSTVVYLACHTVFCCYDVITLIHTLY